MESIKTIEQPEIADAETLPQKSQICHKTKITKLIKIINIIIIHIIIIIKINKIMFI